MGRDGVGGERMHVYCLFCQTQRCAVIARFIENDLHCRAIAPKIIQRKWVGKTPFEVVHDYLPGYIFLYAETPLENIHRYYKVDGILRCLSDRDHAFELYGDDLKFANMLYEMNGTIGILKTYQEGETVKLCKGPLAGFEGEIVRLDRRRGRCQVRFMFEHQEQMVWVGYEMMDEDC